jgi:naringenin 3-dioxygenase
MAPVSSSAAMPFLPTMSEEATLRPSFVREEDERPRVAHDSFSDVVPVVSLEAIDGARRAEIRARVAAACEDWGIFQVVDHGVDAALVAEMTHLASGFFALPPEDKLRFDMSGGKKGGFIVSSHLQVRSIRCCLDHAKNASMKHYSRVLSVATQTTRHMRVITLLIKMDEHARNQVSSTILFT